MSRYARRTDRNHAAIRDGLRAILGAENVRDTSRYGDGFPDLMAYLNSLWFIEIKWPGEKQTPAEVEMQEFMRDNYIIAESLEDALRQLGLTD